MQIDVEMWKPGSLLDAMSLACSCEHRAQWTTPTTQQLALPRPRRTTCIYYPNITTSRTCEVAGHANSQQRTLTPTSMANRRQQGLCYKCNEWFLPGRRYKKLFVLEIDPDVADDMEDAHFSS